MSSVKDPEKKREYHRRWVERTTGRVVVPRKPYGPRSSSLRRVTGTEKRRTIARRYGLAALAALDAWDGICGLCQRPAKRPTIDHNHDTGAFRSIICHGCNLGLGLFKDSPELLDLAAAYIRSFSQDGE